MKIIIDWKSIKTFEDFFDFFLPLVEAPSWHGRNLNAFRDSIVVGDINGKEPPFSIENRNLLELEESNREVYDAVNGIFKEAKMEGREISVSDLPET